MLTYMQYGFDRCRCKCLFVCVQKLVNVFSVTKAAVEHFAE